MGGRFLHPGLVWLLRRTPRTWWRSVRRRFNGWKGGLLALFCVFFALMMLAPNVIESLLDRRVDDGELAARARAFGPLIMLSMTAMSLLAPAQRRGGLYFKPPEIGLLFPAPISRRQLLIYHVLSRAQIQVLSAAFMTLVIIRHAPTWYGCVLGILLALLFLQMLSQTVALVTAAAGLRVARPVRFLVFALVLAALFVGGASAVAQLQVNNGPLAAMSALVAHPVVQIVTLPFLPFANTFAATSILDTLLWSAVSCAVLASLLAIVMKLDVAYEEAALAVSRDVRRKLERMRSGGGGAMAMMGPSSAKFSVPHFPEFGGAGPIAWRQTVEIVRNARAVMTSMVLLLLMPAIMGGSVFFASDGSGNRAQILGRVLIPMVLMFSVVWTQNISFDFRRDLDRIAYLRSLPISSLAVAAGQIIPASVLLAAMQFVTVGAVIVLTGLLPLSVVPALFPLLLPFAFAVFALDNMLFLLFPHRLDPDDAANVGFMGRMMLTMSLKFAGLFVMLAIAGGIGAGLGFLAGRSIVVGVLVAVLLLVAMDVALTFLLARTYDAFDPGRDVPA